MWIILALVAAIGQASEMALKKHALRVNGKNNTVAFLSYSVSGIMIGIVLYLNTGSLWHNVEKPFSFWSIVWLITLLNMVGVWALYKALDLAELSYLMPYMVLTSLTIVIPPIFINGEIPSLFGLAGIVVVVLGVLIMEGKITVGKKEKKDGFDLTAANNRKGLMLFMVTALCYTFTPSLMKRVIIESSWLYVSFWSHILIGISFLPFVLTLDKKSTLRSEERKGFITAVILAGLIIGISNCSINYAYTETKVAYVMAIKRLMPVFAFFIGYFIFKEHENASRKMIATAVMTAGAVIIMLFGK